MKGPARGADLLVCGHPLIALLGRLQVERALDHARHLHEPALTAKIIDIQIGPRMIQSRWAQRSSDGGKVTDHPDKSRFLSMAK
jgi:hypothetical protein